MKTMETLRRQTEQQQGFSNHTLSTQQLRGKMEGSCPMWQEKEPAPEEF